MSVAYRIAICDDSSADRGYIHSLLASWAEAAAAPVSVQEFSSAEGFLFAYAEEKAWDILLLDIEMGTMDGVALARRLRQDNETMQIVFITGYSDYIADGYDVAALHYLMKPVKAEKFRQVMDRAVEKLHRNEKVLTLESGGELVRIPVYQVVYADVMLNYVTIHARETVRVRMTLSQLEQALDDRFYRVGRSLLVNLTQVRRVTRQSLTLSDGTVLPLPRGAYEGINHALIGMR